METLVAARGLSTGEMTAPCLCIDVEMSSDVSGIPPQSGPVGAANAWVLVTFHSEPIGSMVIEVPPEGLTGDQIKATAMAELGAEIRRRSDSDATTESAVPSFLASRQQVLACAPKMTVMVCTRERPERLKTCLESLLAQEYPNFSVLVIDNFPVTDRTKAVIDALDSPLDHVCAPTGEGCVACEEPRN